MAKTWHELPIVGLSIGKRAIEAWLTSPDLRPFLLTCDARGKNHTSYFDAEERRIYVCASIDPSDLPLCLLRELCHAGFWAATAEAVEFWLIEERAVRLLAPLLVGPLQALGWTAPVLPEGYAELHAHAIYVRRRERATKG